MASLRVYKMTVRGNNSTNFTTELKNYIDSQSNLTDKRASIKFLNDYFLLTGGDGFYTDRDATNLFWDWLVWLSNNHHDINIRLSEYIDTDETQAVVFSKGKGNKVNLQQEKDKKKQQQVYDLRKREEYTAKLRAEQELLQMRKMEQQKREQLDLEKYMAIVTKLFDEDYYYRTVTDRGHLIKGFAEDYRRDVRRDHTCSDAEHEQKIVKNLKTMIYDEYWNRSMDQRQDDARKAGEYSWSKLTSTESREVEGPAGN
jgi:hypothetical protein